MKFLTLMRHAKSSWSDLSSDDFDRPLAPRGEQAAPTIGRYLAALEDAQTGPIDLIICSPAKRAEQTLQAVLPQLTGRPAVEFQKQVYLAATAKLLQIVHNAPDSANHLLMIGHNPGFHDLALQLARPEKGHKHAALAAKFPTAAAATLGFDTASWRDIKPASGTLIAFQTPKRLPSE